MDARLKMLKKQCCKEGFNSGIKGLIIAVNISFLNVEIQIKFISGGTSSSEY
jgi:hypothetical protein